MKRKLFILAFIVASIGFAGCAAEQYTQTSKHHAMKVDTLRAMKMDDVIALSKAGVSDSLIIGMMDATDTWFRLKTQDVIDLRNAGVSERVIAAMMQPPPQPSSKTSDSNVVRYYTYPPFFWYDGFYPYWYYPTFSVRMGYYYGSFHRGRFR
jgi:hypothetical protein